jgi:hypothetical protein
VYGNDTDDDTTTTPTTTTTTTATTTALAYAFVPWATETTEHGNEFRGNSSTETHGTHEKTENSPKTPPKG